MKTFLIKQDQQEKVKYMTTEPVPKLISSLAIPTIISMLVSSFYSMIDTFFVGKINTQSTAAVGVVFSVMALIQALGFFFGHGSGNYISRKLGSKEYEEVNKMASTGFFLAIFFGILFAIIGTIFLNPLSIMLGSTETILPYTKAYLRFILIAAPVMMGSLVLNNQLRYQGSAAYGMVGIVSGAVINIVLDPIFIFVFKMGVGGASLATLISQTCSFILLIIMNNKSGGIKIGIKYFTFNFYFINEIIKGGFPSLCRQGLGSIAAIFLNQAAAVYGDVAIAGMSIVSRVTMFANSALIGFGQGFQPVCGFNYGAGLYGRVREGFKFCVKCSTGFLIVVSGICAVFAPQIIAIFIKEDTEVIAIGALTLRLQCIVFPLSAWIVMCNMMLQSIGKAAKASIVASARQGLFFLPMILILPRLFGLFGIQVSQTIADAFTFALTVPLGLSTLKELKQQEMQRCSIDFPAE